MSMHRVRYVSKRTGKVKVYEYWPRDYYEPAVERAKKALKKRPLRLVKKGGGGGRWSAGRNGPQFQDSTVVKLIEEGYAVCVGDFIELKGKIR